MTVAGKTGTAQNDDADGNPADPHAWFIAFAPAEAPQFAVAVIVEHGGTPRRQRRGTGGQVAAPIAKTMLQTLLGLPQG